MPMNWEKLGQNDILELQSRKLRSFLRRNVSKHCRFYRELWKREGIDLARIKTVADLAILPFTHKSDIVPTPERPDAPKDFILIPDPEELKRTLGLGDMLSLLARRYLKGESVKDQLLDRFLPIHYTFTTGRSALPTPFLYTKYDISIMREAAVRLITLSGLNRKEDNVLNIFPYAPHLGFWFVFFAGLDAGIPLIHTGGGKVMGTAKIVELLRRINPTTIAGTPGYVYHFLQEAVSAKVKASRLRLVILGAERTSPQFKDKLKDMAEGLGARELTVLATYAFTESKKAWIECTDRAGSRYHLYPDFEIVEIIDPKTLDPVPPGSPGEVVYTAIDGAGSIVIRYRTGDIVKEGIEVRKCEFCGRTLPLLGTTVTRVSEIIKVKDTLVNMNDLFPLFSGFPEVLEWQVEIGKHNNDPFGPDELILKVSVKDDLDREGFEKEINRIMKRDFEVHFDRFFYYTRQDLAQLLGMDTLSKEARILDSRPNLERRVENSK